ncbi:11832_t:CDS:2 [Entrophospora sp. SA101]|nr:11832_t:CDS:2 [Entrophospora sp. SA101]
MSQQNRSEENPKKRKTLTKAQKKELCEKKRDNPNIKGIDLAKSMKYLHNLFLIY